MSSEASPLFFQENRFKQDDCAQTIRDLQNQSIGDYRLFNMYRTNKPDCTDDKKQVTEFMSQNRMVLRDGYGLTNGCMVDVDSAIRLGGEITNERYKEQLQPRVYHAVPSLNRGGLVPEVETRLIQAEMTNKRRPCYVAEEYTGRFLPMLPCLENTIQNPKHIVPEWTWGGEPTRDTVRQRLFLEEHGYQFDGQVWNKKMCSVGESK